MYIWIAAWFECYGNGAYTFLSSSSHISGWWSQTPSVMSILGGERFCRGCGGRQVGGGDIPCVLSTFVGVAMVNSSSYDYSAEFSGIVLGGWCNDPRVKDPRGATTATRTGIPCTTGGLYRQQWPLVGPDRHDYGDERFCSGMRSADCTICTARR